MAFGFKSIGHFFSTAIHDVFVGAKAVETTITKVNTPANQKLVEDFTALIPSIGPAASDIERGVFAIAGETASVLNDATKNGESALVNAGFDAQIIAEFKALIASIPGTIKNPPALPATTTAAPPPPAA